MCCVNAYTGAMSNSSHFKIDSLDLLCKFLDYKGSPYVPVIKLDLQGILRRKMRTSWDLARTQRPTWKIKRRALQARI